MDELMEHDCHKMAHLKKQAFLAAFEEVGSVRRAAELAEIDRRTHYRWLSEDSEYLSAFQSAKVVAADALESEAIRRAKDGVEEPVFYQGEVCGTVRKYSDTLLIFLLKGAMPQKYRDNAAVELTGSNAGPVNLQVSFVGALPEGE